MKRIRKRGLLARIESVEERLALPVPAPLPGQQTIPVDEQTCGMLRDTHQSVAEDEPC